MVDRVRALKRESTNTGGDSADDVDYPTPTETNEDALDARGYYIQNDSSNDTNVLISRDVSNNLTLKDSVAGIRTLTEIFASDPLQLIKFIDEGPADGFATGATKVVTGTVFPSQILWKRADTTKLVEKNITWTGAFPTTIQWKLYAADGSTVLKSVTDSISYSGAFETGRTRTIA